MVALGGLISSYEKACEALDPLVVQLAHLALCRRQEGGPGLDRQTGEASARVDSAPTAAWIVATGPLGARA
jgi:hypothetical protein